MFKAENQETQFPLLWTKMYVCMYLKFISRHMSHSDSFARRVQQAMNESDERNMSLTVF